jgi:hypothetical protein
MKSRVSVAGILFLSFLLSGCGSLQPIDPADTRTLVLEEPAVGHDLISRVTLPAGVYKAASYAETGTYFSAPSPLRVQSVGSLEASGGIFLPNDLTKEQVTFYAYTSKGRITGTFDAPLRYVIKP